MHPGWIRPCFNWVLKKKNKDTKYFSGLSSRSKEVGVKYWSKYFYRTWDSNPYGCATSPSTVMYEACPLSFETLAFYPEHINVEFDMNNYQPPISYSVVYFGA